MLCFVTPPAKSPKPAAQASTMRSLERALQIYEGLQRSDGAQRLSDIANAHAMSSATVLRILRVLEGYGLVTRTPAGYRVGAASLPAAQRYLQTDPLLLMSGPVLDELAQATGLTASLYSRIRDERILVARSHGQNPLRYQMPFGIRLPLTKGAAGKVLLFGSDDDELARVLAHHVRLGYEDATATLSQVRARLAEEPQGYASSMDEREAGVGSVAVVVPRRGAEATEAISLTTPSEKLGLEALLASVPELRRAAQTLGARLEGEMY